ncbi:MAG: nickel-dependent lactate racemase [Chloroflexi bacterium]|nr:nickel-dependent lactate racemase [Chloroflexota bacterium]
MTKLSMRLDTGPISCDLPDDWQVNNLSVSSAPALTPDEMRDALRRPIGAPRISELARGKRTAVIIVDDLTRPTPAYAYVPLIIEELKAGGIADAGIKIIGGIGCHRPMLSVDFRRKVGDWVVDRYECITHNPHEHNVYVGTTPRGIRVEINDEVAEADVKIVAGGIIPHGSAGFGGGAKLILPGVCSIGTITAHHSTMLQGARRCLVEGNEFRDELEQIARVAGLDAIVNCVMNADVEVAGLFAGDLVAAHRAGVEAARELYAVDAPRGVDAAIVSGFPQDREFGQSLKGMHRCPATVREGGTVLFVSAGTEGPGFHHLGERARKAERHSPAKPPASPAGEGRHLIVYCPTVGPDEVARRIPPTASFHRDLASAVAELRARHSRASVNVFPQGALTIIREG